MASEQTASYDSFQALFDQWIIQTVATLGTAEKNTNGSRLGHFFPEAPVLRAPLKQKWSPKMVAQTEKVILEYDQLLRLYVI